MAAAAERTVGSLAAIVAAAQKRGEIIEGDPAVLTLTVGAALHGIATFAANGHTDAQAAVDAVDTLVHLLLHGLLPR